MASASSNDTNRSEQRAAGGDASGKRGSDSDAAGDAEQKRNGAAAAQETSAPGTAHNLYNSYTYNPWSAYPNQGQFGSAGKGAIESKEGILEKEMTHLKSALNEKTKEVERLRDELDKAYQMVEHLKSQNMALSNSLAIISTQAHSSHTAQNGSASAAVGAVQGDAANI